MRLISRFNVLFINIYYIDSYAHFETITDRNLVSYIERRLEHTL
jgi:hypothetical protein